MDIITLINKYVSGLLNTEEKFLEHLDSLTTFEETVSRLSNQMTADFIGLILTDADRMIRGSGFRKGSYTVQRSHQRTLISSVGDITFTHILYKDQSGKIRCLLDELIRLPDRERFTAVAEAKVLNEAEVHSYQHAAESIQTNGQAIIEQSPCHRKRDPGDGRRAGRKEAVRIPVIEADEDHIHRQQDGKEQGCFIGKLIDLFEGKEEICKGKRKLVRPFYFGGLYAGSERNAALWEEVEAYIRNHYDQEVLRCVYISSDGGGWIRTAADHIYKGRLVADWYHLMKYINRVAKCTQKEEDTKKRFYKYIYKDNLPAVKKLLTRIENHCEKGGHAVEECRRYFVRN